MTEGIPEWLFWVATAIGTAIGAVIIRIGAKGGGPFMGPHSHTRSSTGDSGGAFIQKVGVLVDNKTIEVLSGSIEGMTMEMITSRKAMMAHSDETVRAGQKIVDELSELRGDVRDLSRSLRERGRT